MSVVHVIFHGRVQGVGFRYFAQSKAQARGLTGFVRNLRNGDVEAMASGPRESLEAFLELLEKGNGYSRVDSADVNYDAGPCEDWKGFEIRHTL